MKLGRKITGGKYHKLSKKKKHSKKGFERKVKLNSEKKKKLKSRGGNQKTVLLSSNYVNVINPKTKKSQKVIIKNVLETPPNRFLARQNILVKSAIIETELGKAKITNRPSQEGMVQAELLNEE